MDNQEEQKTPKKNRVRKLVISVEDDGNGISFGINNKGNFNPFEISGIATALQDSVKQKRESVMGGPQSFNIGEILKRAVDTSERIRKQAHPQHNGGAGTNQS